MARPQRNNVDYFPFYCEEGKKMYYLEETYGNDGFAVFMKLLRELARTDYHYLNLSKNTTLMFLSAKCKVPKEVLLSIINDLVELDKFDRYLWSNCSVIWCQDFINSIQDAYNKRNNKCITYDSLLSLLSGLGVTLPSKGKSKAPVNPQSKEEYSKEEKSIYELYPSKCPINNSNTGKTKKHKDKIKTLLKEYSFDDLKARIEWYISDCKQHNRFIKNFGTFLNNIPEIEEKPKKPPLFECTYAMTIKRYEVSTEEEAKIKFFNNSGVYPELIEKIR